MVCFWVVELLFKTQILLKTDTEVETTMCYVIWLYCFVGLTLSMRTNTFTLFDDYIIEFVGSPLAPSRTAQKMKFSVKNFFRMCDQIRRKLWIWSHLLKKLLWKTSFFVQFCRNQSIGLQCKLTGLYMIGNFGH